MNDESISDLIDTFQISYYLRGRGWTQHEVFGDQEEDPKGALWIRAEGDIDLWVPYKKSLGDYAHRLHEVYQQLEAIEKRSIDAIVSDVLLAKSDLIKVRANHPGSRDGTIPLEDGIAFVENARKLLDASASATFSKQSYFPGRRPQVVYDFMRNVRLGQTEKGSYVLNIVSHVSPSLKSEITAVAIEEPFERRVVTTMATALSRTASAAKSAAATGDFRPFKDAVKHGVTGNLCEAIVGLGALSSRSNVSFSFLWSPTREAPANVPNHVQIEPDYFDVINEAARLFKETFVSEEREIEGYIVNIKDSQSAGQRAGRVAIATSVDDQVKKVLIDLAGDDYIKAGVAIGHGNRVKCSGMIEKEGNRLLIKNPKHFLVTEED